MHRHVLLFFFFFNDTATTEIYTLSLHDALPILAQEAEVVIEMLDDIEQRDQVEREVVPGKRLERAAERSEEHTSELQSQSNLVCRLLLEKKKKCRRHFVHFRLHNRDPECSALIR